MARTENSSRLFIATVGLGPSRIRGVCGVSATARNGFGAAFGDYDRDGYLDLFTTGWTDLNGVAHELAERLGSLFVPQEGRPRPCHGSFAHYADDPHWRDYVLFYEYFDGDTGRGLGASHQTGWTALIACLLEDCANKRGARADTTNEHSRESILSGATA